VSAADRQRWLAAARNALVDARVDAASLAVFRMLFGLLLAGSMVRFLALGWVDEFYVAPTFHFTWALAPWAAPWPGWLMHAHFVALAILGCAIAVGYRYRVCAALFFLGFTYVELLDKTTYLNHYYLVSLLTGLLVVIPAHRAWSFDSWGRGGPLPTVPVWTLNLMRFQIAVVYLFAGLAKLNHDWLMTAQPMRMWLAARSDLAIIGPFLASEPLAYAFSWLGAAYDLSIVFLLLRRRTRPLAYVSVLIFHAMTAVLFPIGMFPWIMTVATLVFFSPDWPRRWLQRWTMTGGANDAPITQMPAWSLAVLVLYVGVQIALPLRAYWPGVDPDWTTRGFNFAWRVMLVEKSGYTELVARDRLTSERWRIDLREFVTERQQRMMAQDPFMVRALARHVAADLRARGNREVEVRAESFASLNGRPPQYLIDPRVDLVGPLGPGWILPLNRNVASDTMSLLRRTARE
jgi:vitamin K-dependent gamma-carboxylase